jgi:TonB family protein
MNDAVSHALVARARDTTGFSRWVGVSSAAHLAMLTLLALIGAGISSPGPGERDVMTVSLGGPPGPRSGGMTPIGGRPVQQVMPPVTAPRSEPVRPPAPSTPEMTLQTRQERPPAKPSPAVRTPPAEPSRSATPTRGDETRAGSAVLETGAKGIGFGLSTGGGGTGGEIDLSSFCCPDYLSTMADLIQRNWNSKQQVPGVSTIRFTIRRDGSLIDVQVAKSSGYAVLDLSAQRAVATTHLPPLPAAYTNDMLTIHLNFEYQR